MRDVFCGLDFVARVIKRRQERNKHTRKENNIHFEIVSKNIISLCIDIQELLEYKHKNDFFFSGGKNKHVHYSPKCKTGSHFLNNNLESPRPPNFRGASIFFSTKGTVSGLQVSRPNSRALRKGCRRTTNQLPTNHQRRPFLPERAIKTCYLPLRGR